MIYFQKMAHTLIQFSIIGFAVSGVSLFGQDLATVIEESEKSLVKIQVQGLEGGAIGSGFVISNDGLVVTNVHVMAGAQKAVASFPDGRNFAIGGSTHIDESRDICIIKLENASDLQPIKLAQKLPRKGETVTALGSPMGLSFTVTKGIVSAIRAGEELGKDLDDDMMKGTWVQVDASLSPGNSGGPLINEKGEVVAMSTRASQGGVAQNLNFGISIKDINEAISKSASASETTLVAGVGKIKDHDLGGGGGDEPNAIFGKKAVPDNAIANYIQRGRNEYSELTKKVRRETTDQDKIYRLMRKGEVGIPPGLNAGPNTAYIAIKGRSRVTYYFRNEPTKRKFVERKGERVGKLKKLKTKLSDSTLDESLGDLLQNAGPRIDPQEPHSVGFLDGVTVIHSYNDHEIVVDYDDQPFLMWVESTVGLSQGQEMDPAIAYVAGTETMKIPGKSTMSVTVLQVVTDREMEKALKAAGAIPANSSVDNDGSEFRTWRSKNGKYSIEAQFIKKEGNVVTLKNKDGDEINVPIDRLDEACYKYFK